MRQRVVEVLTHELIEAVDLAHRLQERYDRSPLCVVKRMNFDGENAPS